MSKPEHHLWYYALMPEAESNFISRQQNCAAEIVITQRPISHRPNLISSPQFPLRLRSLARSPDSVSGSAKNLSSTRKLPPADDAQRASEGGTIP